MLEEREKQVQRPWGKSTSYSKNSEQAMGQGEQIQEIKIG